MSRPDLVEGSIGARVAASRLGEFDLYTLADIAWSPGSRRVAWVVSSKREHEMSDDSIGVLDVETGRVLARSGSEHWSYGDRVAFDGSRESLLTPWGHRLIVRMDSRTLGVREVLIWVGAVASFHDFEVSGDRIFAFKTEDPRLRALHPASWDSGTGSLEAEWPFAAVTDPVGLAVDRDGDTVVICEPTRGATAAFHAWELKSEAHTFIEVAGVCFAKVGRQVPQWSLSADGRRLAVGSRGGATLCYRIPSGERIASLPPPEGGGAAQAVELSPDGSLVVVGYEGYGVQLFDVETRERRGRIEQPRPAGRGKYWGAERVCFSPDGASLAVLLHDGSLQVFSLETGSRRR